NKIEELLDIENPDITMETLIVQDLGAESIDLLELAVSINSRFDITVNDDEIFLTRFRLYSTEANQSRSDAVSYIAGKYPFLPISRVEEILTHIKEGPQLKVKDLISYISHRRREA
ncbi:MAG TPA: phosphopantetheine-binding protein, partial [Syntrophales bacterium]|nr:phosphopantetheine-binding protein [Syntrophales bacterium]